MLTEDKKQTLILMFHYNNRTSTLITDSLCLSMSDTDVPNSKLPTIFYMKIVNILKNKKPRNLASFSCLLIMLGEVAMT